MRWAEPDQVVSATEEWSDKVVACRIYGHGWKPLSVTRDSNGYTVIQRCASCGNRRLQAMDFRGFAGPWTYIYKEGYLTKDLGRIGSDGRAVLRLAAIRNLTVRDVSDSD
jgi:hypothetical protein